jgi:membrane protease YdiL (CAAX protease family)
VDEETILRLKENYKKFPDQQLIEMLSYSKDAYEEAAWDLIVKEAVSRNLKLLSLESVVLMPIIYLFGSVAIGVLVGGISAEAPEIASGVIFLFVLVLTIVSVKRYSGYFFPGSWKINFYDNLKIGFNWSILFVILTGIGASNPEIRAKWLNYYLTLHNLSQENITNIAIILISAVILIASFLEELIYRGMIQQYIKKFLRAEISVLITAGIFTLAHFVHFLTMPFSIGDVGALFICGVLTGFAFNKANSCISSSIPHLVFNIKYIVIIPLMLAF